MSCSKDSTIKDMLEKGFITPSLVLRSKGITPSLGRYLQHINNLAKKYGVSDPLFAVKGAEDKYYLKPNEAGFEAIDNSKKMLEQQNRIIANRQSYWEQKQAKFDNFQREKEGHYTVDDEGDVVPAHIPPIKINCK